MANKPVQSFIPDYSFPPGDTLAEVIESRGITQRQLAERTGLTPKTVNEIIKGKAPISPETALQLERVLGVPASFWTNLQRRYDDFRAREAESERLADCVDWAKQFPVRDLKRWGWIAAWNNSVDLVRSLLNYFGTATPEAWSAEWRSCQVAFRSATKKADPHALACWLRRGEIEAAAIETEPYDAISFRKALEAARGLTTLPGAGFQEPLITECAGAGVAVVFVPELRRVCTYGATRWLAPEKALIQLSLRQKSDDHLWFTFFHEAAHILLHGKRTVFLEQDDGRKRIPEEEEANRFAGDFLVPPSAYEAFERAGEFTEASVRAFAQRIGIAPGIVVGRLQHAGQIGFGQLNSLKKRYRFREPAMA